jgi:sugar-specific transcriptional regulator TrmB
VNLERATAKEIWKLSGVAREEVYRKLNELKKLGFIEQSFSRPSFYKACPIDCVIGSLLKKKAVDISNLQEETNEMLENIMKNKKQNHDENEILLIPENRPLLEKAKTELRFLKKSLDTICSWEKGIGWLLSHHDHFMKALDRNVKIRFIIEKNNDFDFPDPIKLLKKKSFFNIKSVPILPPACLGIYDQKKLLLDTSSKTGFVKSPVLWSNNPSIVGMAQIYFDKIWT